MKLIIKMIRLYFRHALVPFRFWYHKLLVNLFSSSWKLLAHCLCFIDIVLFVRIIKVIYAKYFYLTSLIFYVISFYEIWR